MIDITAIKVNWNPTHWVKMTKIKSIWTGDYMFKEQPKGFTEDEEVMPLICNNELTILLLKTGAFAWTMNSNLVEIPR